MGMLFARRRNNKVGGVTTTENLLQRGTEHNKPKAKNVPVETKSSVEKPATNLKFKV